MGSTKRPVEAQAFASRLRQALADAGVRASPTLVANEFNLRYWGKSITVHAARNWLMGTSMPSQDKLVALASWLQVNPQELRFGTASAQHLNEPDRLLNELNLRDREMLTHYLSLSAEHKGIVCEVVRALAKMDSPKKK